MAENIDYDVVDDRLMMEGYKARRANHPNRRQRMGNAVQTMSDRFHRPSDAGSGVYEYRTNSVPLDEYSAMKKYIADNGYGPFDIGEETVGKTNEIGRKVLPNKNPELYNKYKMPSRPSGQFGPRDYFGRLITPVAVPFGMAAAGNDPVMNAVGGAGMVGASALQGLTDASMVAQPFVDAYNYLSDADWEQIKRDYVLQRMEDGSD